MTPLADLRRKYKAMNNHAGVVQLICETLLEGRNAEASAIARAEYPHRGQPVAARRFTKRVLTAIFIRDGFIDRYTGQQLVFPGALRLLSRLLPNEFPYHPSWKMSESHIVYWQLYPTIDHVIPIARGGAHESENWVCTSMLENSRKSNWALDELQSTLHDPGDIHIWDGLIGWFQEYVERDRTHLQEGSIREWHNALKHALLR